MKLQPSRRALPVWFTLEHLERRDVPSALSVDALALLRQRSAADNSAFYFYRDADAGENHAFFSGVYGNDHSLLNIAAGGVDAPMNLSGISSDEARRDTVRGDVLKLAFSPMTSTQFVGVNAEEPEKYSSTLAGRGYDVRGAEFLRFEARSQGGVRVRFSFGGKDTAFYTIPVGSNYKTYQFPLKDFGLTDAQLSDLHILFGVGTNGIEAPTGGTLLLDNIRLEPAPFSVRNEALFPHFPLANATVGVVRVQSDLPGLIKVPPDQLLRNLTTTYETALTINQLLGPNHGTTQDLLLARQLADTFVYALYHDNSGLPLPTAPGGRGLRNGYSSGALPLYNGQGTGMGQQGETRLAGFDFSPKYALLLDGASGGNNAFAMLALLTTYEQLGDDKYLFAAGQIGNWIEGNLRDTTGTGYGGYFVGYPDRGAPKVLQKGKSVENNADIFAAFRRLAAVESARGNPSAAAVWNARAKAAGDFVIAMYEPIAGRFYAGTVPAGQGMAFGIVLTGIQRGNDVINGYDYADASTFTTLALAGDPDYQGLINWRRPTNHLFNNFREQVTAGSHVYDGFNLVRQAGMGTSGVAWEFTAQAVAVFRFVDRLYGESHYKYAIDYYAAELREAQQFAPGTDRLGLPASTLNNGDTLPPRAEAIHTPFQDIAQRVGLAATAFAAAADEGQNPLVPVAGLNHFLSGLYRDVLGRTGTAPELRYWTNVVLAGGTAQGITATFLTSPEYRARLINADYDRYLRRTANDDERAYWQSQFSAGATAETVERSIVSSGEYFMRQGGTNDAYVRALYRDILGRTGDSGGVTYWVNQLTTFAQSRSQVAAAFLASSENRSRVIDAAYRQYLKRGAGAAEIEYWTAQLASGLSWENLARNLLLSEEYAFLP